MYKDILPTIIFCKILGIWKLPYWACSGPNYARFEEFIPNAESVKKLLQIELGLAFLSH